MDIYRVAHSIMTKVQPKIAIANAAMRRHLLFRPSDQGPKE
jgi:hypothetical protein